ncbi:14282_t:CDS:2 [Entrophospora sp. SA101]|nr:14282_t:CDS:2 [Entrophospora sp. SA101]
MTSIRVKKLSSSSTESIKLDDINDNNDDDDDNTNVSEQCDAGGDSNDSDK